jgi:hypothetical protein
MRHIRLTMLLAVWLAAPFGLLARPAHADAPIIGRRVALVIGNGAYRNVDPLPNVVSDARLIASTLRDLHFTLVGGDAQIDLDRAHLAQAVQDFGHAIAGAEVTLFYYSGHGLQVQGVNWLVPIDANPTRPQDLDFQMVDADLVLRQMDGNGTKLNLVLLDACRNNPFGNRGLRALQPGLAEMRAPEGTLISYATQPGNVAMDGTGANSPYTTALAAGMRRPGLDIFRMFNQVGLQVKRGTDGSQQPWVSNSPIDGDFYFVPPVPPAPDAPTEPGPPAQEVLATPPPPPPPSASAPAQPSASPVEIARETVRAHPCSVLDARLAGAAIEISGIAVRGAEWNALAAAIDKTFGANRGLRPGRFDVEMLPAFACKAVEALAPAIRRARDAGGARLLAPPRAEQTAGQQMAVTLRVPAGARVTADLFRPPNAVEHLAVTGAGDRLVIPLPAGAPPGPRVLSVVMSNGPLDLPPGSVGADAAVYLAALSAALRTTPDAMADMAAFELRAAAPHPSPQAAPASSPPAPSRVARPGRCSGILERAQLGEPLSDADRAALRGECR